MHHLARRPGPRAAASAILFGLVACTSANPAYETGDGDGSAEGTAAEGTATEGGGTLWADGTATNPGSGDGSGGTPACNPDDAAPDDHTCDGIDDDCDGLVDEDYAASSGCGVGACKATSTPSSCTTGVETPCTPGQPTDEVPDDDVDQDCDGSDAVSGALFESFWDDFADGMVDPRWDEPSCGDGCSIAEQSSSMHFGMQGPACTCTIATVDAYRLTNQHVLLDVPAITSFFPTLRFSMAVVTEQGDRIEYGFDGNSDVFFAEIEANGVTTFAETSTYVPRPRFWRIREQDGQLSFESSPDGGAWDVEMQTETPFFVGAVRFRFGAEVSGPMPSPVGISVPTYNALP